MAIRKLSTILMGKLIEIQVNISYPSIRNPTICQRIGTTIVVAIIAKKFISLLCLKKINKTHAMIFPIIKDIKLIKIVLFSKRI